MQKYFQNSVFFVLSSLETIFTVFMFPVNAYFYLNSYESFNYYTKILFVCKE